MKFARSSKRDAILRIDRRNAQARTADGPAAAASELGELNRELDDAAGRYPLMQVCVDAQIVGEVISGWTGIPVGKMMKDEIETVLELEQHLGSA